MFNPKGAIKSLVAQGRAPPFPFNLWHDVLCDCLIDFATIVDDHHSLVPQQHNSIELEDGGKLAVQWSTPMKGRKLHLQSDWWMAFDKYKCAVLWAYPH